MYENISILCVEDEDDIREEMEDILSLEFKNAYVAKNGIEGVEAFKKYRPDLILSDAQMPLMDGLEMSEKILQEEPNAKIIMTTAYNEEEFIKKMEGIGVQKYINKPININELFDKIEMLLNSVKR